MESKQFYQSSVLISTITSVLSVIFVLVPRVKQLYDASGLTVASVVTGVLSCISFASSIVAAVKRLKNTPTLPIAGTPAASGPPPGVGVAIPPKP